MLYDSYVEKIRKRYQLRRLIYRYRILITVVISLITVLSSAFLITKGSVYNLEYNDKLSYGEEFKISSSGLFSGVRYEYRQKEQKEWTNEKPLVPGEYEVKIITSKAFGSKKETIKNFII